MRRDDLKIKKNIVIIIILLIIVFFSFFFLSKNNKFIKDISEFVSTDIKVLYISDKDNYSNYPIEVLKKYDINYIYINSDKLSNFEKSKLQQIINSKYLSNIIVIFDKGNVIDALIEYENEESLNKFFQTNEIIPEIIGDNSKIIDSVNKLLKTEYSLIYIPYQKTNVIDSQNEILKKICEEYNINYKKIDAYLLSNNQQKKLNSLLAISTVSDQIIIMVKNKEITGSVRGINTKKEYLSKLIQFNFIEEVGSSINNIDIDEFNNLLNSNEKNIILLGKDNCKYCDKVNNILNEIAINYNIKINYINVKKNDSEISKQINDKFNELEYNDGFNLPITIIVENNNLLEYIIGESKKEYFVEIFIENGIIK